MKERKSKFRKISYINETRVYLYSKRDSKGRGSLLIRMDLPNKDDRSDGSVVSGRRKK